MKDFSATLTQTPTDIDALSSRAGAHLGLDQFEDADADLTLALTQQPKSAELILQRAQLRFLAGHFDESAKDFAALNTLAGSGLSGQTPRSALWRFIAQARAKQDGRSSLTTVANTISSRTWPGAMLRFFLGEVSADTVMAQADDGSLKRCQANFYLGHAGLILDDRAQARERFSDALTTCEQSSVEYHSALLELKQL